MGCGFVGVLTADLHLPEGASLKTKRKELLRVKHGLTRRIGCSVAEVDHHDLWQRSRLTLAVACREAGEAERQLDAASRWLHGDEAFLVVSEARDIVAVSGDPTFADA